MWSSIDKILVKTGGNLLDFLPKLIKEYPNKNWKTDKKWMTFCETCAQPDQLNALQEAVGHGHPKLQILLPQLKTPLRWSCKFYTRFAEYSLIPGSIGKQCVKITKKYGRQIEK